MRVSCDTTEPPRSLNIFWLPRARVRKSRYWGEMLLSPIHCCVVTKPPYLFSGKLFTSPLHSNRLYVYTACCRRGGQCLSLFRTRHTDVVGDSSGRSYVTEQGHNVPLLRTRGLESVNSNIEMMTLSMMWNRETFRDNVWKVLSYAANGCLHCDW